MKKELAQKFYDFISSLGLDPVFIATIIGVTIYILAYKNDIKNWDNLNSSQKNTVIVYGVGAFSLLVISLLRILDIITGK